MQPLLCIMKYISLNTKAIECLLKPSISCQSLLLSNGFLKSLVEPIASRCSASQDRSAHVPLIVPPMTGVIQGTRAIVPPMAGVIQSTGKIIPHLCQLLLPDYKNQRKSSLLTASNSILVSTKSVCNIK